MIPSLRQTESHVFIGSGHKQRLLFDLKTELMDSPSYRRIFPELFLDIRKAESLEEVLAMINYSHTADAAGNLRSLEFTGSEYAEEESVFSWLSSGMEPGCFIEFEDTRCRTYRYTKTVNGPYCHYPVGRGEDGSFQWGDPEMDVFLGTFRRTSAPCPDFAVRRRKLTEAADSVGIAWIGGYCGNRIGPPEHWRALVGHQALLMLQSHGDTRFAINVKRLRNKTLHNNTFRGFK